MRNKNIDLQKGNNLYLYTDIIVNQLGEPKARPDEGPFGQEKKFKYKQLNQLFLSKTNERMGNQMQILNSTLQSWKGSLEQVDDICIIGIKI